MFASSVLAHVFKIKILPPRELFMFTGRYMSQGKTISNGKLNKLYDRIIRVDHAGKYCPFEI